MHKLYFLKTTILLSAFALPTFSISQPVIVPETVISGLSAPIQIVNAGDGTNRLFVVQQGGAILVYDQDHNPLGTFLTVTGINAGGEEGLLSMVFHPEYENPLSPFFGHFYVYYTNSNGDLQLARYQVSSNPNIADPATKDTILTIPHPGQSNHNGATLHFGTDGYLYWATGDGGGGGDAPNNAQNGAVLLGKMLRIDVNSSPTPPFYSIPVDNPFISTPGVEPEIYAFGLRNPFRWSFDRLTGDIWIGDVGQGTWEEIHYSAAGSTAGVNYGWRCYEGNAPFNLSGCGPSTNYEFPVFVYPNPSSGASAVTGGVVYRGPIAELQGYYIASDFYSGTFYMLTPDGLGGFVVDSQLAVIEGVSNFGEAEDGNVYALSLFDGTVSLLEGSGVLPTGLTTFTAAASNGLVKLDWRTAFEQNLERFEVQYSADGSSYTSVGSVNATNNATGADYTFTHQPAPSARAYYRLRMIDFDGQFEFSNVVSITQQGSQRNFVMPSVISGGIMNVYLPGEFKMLDVISMNGSRMLRQNIGGRSGRIDVNIPTTTPAGTYIIQLSSDDNVIRQRVLIR